MEIVRFHFPSLDSTNNWSKQKFESFSKSTVTLVTADTQTAGRGRNGRVWSSPAHQNLYATWNFTVPTNYKIVGQAPIRLAIAVARFLEQREVPCRLKWPNDLLIKGKKVGGILTETLALQEHLGIVLGLGLNINSSRQQLAHLPNPATSLIEFLGTPLDCEVILQGICQEFIPLLETQSERNFDLFEEYRERLIHRPGDFIAFKEGVKEWQGTFHSILEDGSLQLSCESGILRSFRAGEIQ